MPTPEVACLNQYAVYWPCTGYDNQGDPTFGSPVSIRVKWEQDTRLLTNPDGSPTAVTTTVFVDRDLVEDGKLWLGKLADLPENPSSVMLIVAFNKIGDVKAKRFTRMATLMRHK